MNPALSAALAAARAAYADFGAKLEALETLLAAPAEPPKPAVPAFEVPTADTAGWKLGQKVSVPFTMAGFVKAMAVYVRGDDKNTWVGEPYDVTAGASFTPAAAGDFLKLWPDDRMDLAKDSSRMPASASPVVAPPPVKVPPVSQPAKVEPAAGGTGLAMAQAFQRRSVFNINWERERFARFSFDATVRDNYRDVGIGGIRGFIPWRPGGDVDEGKRVQFWDLDLEKAPTKDQFNRFKPNAKAITEAGLILMLDLLDEVPMDSFNDSRLPVVKRYLADACAWIKEWQIDPALLCVGPVNEYRGEDNQTWEPLRFAFDAILQAELGDRYLLGQAPAYWGHHSNYTGNDHGKYNPGPNPQRIHFWHAYDRNSAAGWAGVQAGISAWSKANGRVVMCGEVGPGGLDDGKDFSAGDGGWVEHIDRQNPALAESVPTLWAATDGDWTMNRGFNDARLWVKDKGWEPEIEAAVRRAVAANRKARGL